MAIPNSFMTLREAPDRYGVDVQSLPKKKTAYMVCDCGEIIYEEDKIYWDIKGTKACKNCIASVLKDFEKEIW